MQRTSISAHPGTLAQLAVMALAAVVRALPHPRLFVGGVLFPFSNDAAYHMRRILRLVEDFRYPGLFDPMFDWPRGAATHWSPGFDCIAAAVALALGSGQDAHRATQVAVALPLVYGVIAVAVVGRLATRALPAPDPYVGAVAAAFVALVPQSVVISQIGFVDHHVTEVIFTALLWWWTLAGIELSEQSAELRRRARFEALGAVLVASAVWVQSVGLLYVGIASAVLALSRLASSSPPPARRPWVGTGAPALAAGAVALLALYAPAVREHGRAFAYEFPSYLQPALLGLAGLAVGVADAALRRLARRGVRGAALVVQVGVAVLAAVAAAAVPFLLASAPRAALSNLFSFAATEGADLSRISELMPLFAQRGGAAGSRFEMLDSTFGWVGRSLIVLLPLGLYAARRAGPPRFAAVSVWTGALCLLSLFQNRWSRPLIVPVAIVGALGVRLLVGWAIDALASRTRFAKTEPAARARLAGPLSVVAAVALLLAPDPAAAVFRLPLRASDAPLEAGLHLRAAGRPAEPGRSSGILASWHLGFELLHASGLPLLSTGHAWLVGEEGFRLERAAWRGSPESLWSLMDERDLGFVVAGVDSLSVVQTPGGPLPLVSEQDRRVDFRRLKEVPLGALMIGGSGLPDLDVRHLEQLCPRFVSSEFAAIEPPLPRLWVYERVPGAILEGHAAPRSRVVAEILLRHVSWVVSYFAFADADESGAFAIRFPVPTRMAEATLQSGKVVRIARAGAAVEKIEVPEAAVRSGGRVTVPPPGEAAPP